MNYLAHYASFLARVRYQAAYPVVLDSNRCRETETGKPARICFLEDRKYIREQTARPAATQHTRRMYSADYYFFTIN